MGECWCGNPNCDRIDHQCVPLPDTPQEEGERPSVVAYAEKLCADYGLTAEQRDGVMGFADAVDGCLTAHREAEQHRLEELAVELERRAKIASDARDPMAKYDDPRDRVLLAREQENNAAASTVRDLLRSLDSQENP